MNYKRWLYERNGELYLELSEEELVEIATDLGILSVYPNGEAVSIDQVLREVDGAMHYFHDINLRLIHPQG